MGKDGMGSNGKGRDGMRKDGRDNPPTPLKLNLPLPQLFFRENPPTPLKLNLIGNYSHYPIYRLFLKRPHPHP